MGVFDAWNYESPRAQTLPKAFTQDILDKLTEKFHWLVDQQLKVNAMEPGLQKDAAQRYVNEQRARHNEVLHFLSSVGLHAAYSWYGHREEYIFPSYDDCEIQEDFMWNQRFE